MKKAKKVLALVLCAVLLVGASIAGTVAYLTDTKTVENTFTVGNVEITLQEYVVDPQTGEKDTAEEPVTGLTNLELIPGREIQKNPFITVTPTSEDCWLFVKVENGLDGAGEIVWDADWDPVPGAAGYYQYKNIIEEKAADKKVDVFTAFKCASTLNNDALASYKGKTIKITAYAIQEDGLTQAEAAAALGIISTP